MNKVVTPVVVAVEVVTKVDDCTIGTVGVMVKDRVVAERLEVGLTLALSDEVSGKEAVAPELDLGIVVEKGSVVGVETGMEGTEMGTVMETENDVEMGIEVGRDIDIEVGREVGTEIGIDVGMDVGIDVGIEMGSDVEMIVGMEIGLEEGMEIGIDDGMEVKIEVGTNVLMELGILVTGMDMDVVVTASLEVVRMEEDEDEEALADVDEGITEVVEEREVDAVDDGSDVVDPSTGCEVLRTVVLGETEVVRPELLEGNGIRLLHSQRIP